jgi:hypothetical protein
MQIILLLHTILLVLTFGNFELLTVDYHSIDAPIAELNNHTLREVFEGGNIITNSLFNDFTGWTLSSNLTETIESGRAKLLVFNVSVGNMFISNTQPILNNQYYYRLDVEPIVTVVSGTNTFGVRIGANVGFTLENNVYKKYSGFITALDTNAVRLQFLGTATLGDIVYVDNYYVIDRTTLGISALTVEQMDYWFSVYQDNIGADDVTYTVNEHDMTDLIILLGFGFSWIGIFWIIRKVIS